MDKQLVSAENLVNLAMKHGADSAIAIVSEGSNRQVRFSNNEVDIVNQWNSEEITIFIVKDNRPVISEFSSTDNIEQRIIDAVKHAKSMHDNSTFGGITRNKQKYRNVIYSNDIGKSSDISAIAERSISSAISEGAKTVAGTFYVYDNKRVLFSSEGPEGKDRSTSVALSVRAFIDKESSGHWVSVTPNLSDLDPEGVGKKAAELAKAYKDPKVGKAGVYDLILAPLFTGSIISSISDMISAFWVEAGQSIFVNKINEKVAPDFVTLYDYADDNTISKRVFDDEGYPITKTVWLENGIFKSYLHNTSTAKRFNVTTTGNAGLIDPTPFFTYVNGGDSSLEEMIKETKHGLFLTNTWYTRFQNAYTGEFSTIPRDAILLIENGEIAGSYKDIRLSDNLARVLSNIDMMSKDRYQVQWWGEAKIPSYSPYIRIRDMHITTSH